ncbi:MAG: chemotaxis-specific protein-glutamate methyltransferase CheB [Pseudomonadota bacterium]
MTVSAAATERPRTVGIIDDSRTIRALLRATLDADPRLEVVGEAGDPYEARAMIKASSPDVVTLDVEMPRMNGLVFLEHLMRLRPMPVVMVSTRTRERSEDAVRALALGAVDCVDVARLQADAASRVRLVDALVHAAAAKVHPRTAVAATAMTEAATDYRWNGRLVLIGSSTGGVDALERVFASFPKNGPPVIVAQHMPPAFLRSFATRLDSLIAPRVIIPEHDTSINCGTIVIAPGGDQHVGLHPHDPSRVTLVPDDGGQLYVPSVDLLFQSALRHGPNCVAVVLTGMGRDGSQVLRGLKDAGSICLVQDGASAVVDGMPRAARETGAADEVCPLDAIGPAILRLTNANSGRAR